MKEIILKPIDIMASPFLTNRSKDILLKIFYPEANEMWQRIKDKIRV